MPNWVQDCSLPNCLVARRIAGEIDIVRRKKNLCTVLIIKHETHISSCPTYFFLSDPSKCDVLCVLTSHHCPNPSLRYFREPGLPSLNLPDSNIVSPLNAQISEVSALESASYLRVSGNGLHMPIRPGTYRTDLCAHRRNVRPGGQRFKVTSN